MASPARVLVVVGTRPEAIKLAPVVRELRRRREAFEVFLLSTGQHREMLDTALSIFDLQPDADLGLMRHDQTLYDVTTACLTGVGSAVRRHGSEILVVQGDTTSAFAAALAAYYERVPVAHVEAGLRTGEPYAPFPEEINRKLVDHIAAIHFAPTAAAVAALLAENIRSEDIAMTGNTVVDAVLMARDIVRRKQPEIDGLQREAIEGHRMILVTAHRRESFGAPFEELCRAMLRLVTNHPDVCIVYPVHRNPNVMRPVQRILGNHPRIHLIQPQPYLEFVSLMDRSHLILTDSGGVQEEAPSLGKPIVVMRDVTERPEGVEAGVACLAGASEEGVYSTASRLLNDQSLYSTMSSATNPYGDGKASVRIVDALQQRFAAGRAKVSARALGGQHVAG